MARVCCFIHLQRSRPLIGGLNQRFLKSCPHCGEHRIVRNGVADWLQRYKCHACGKTFNALTGTPLARLRHKGKWLDQAQALADGLTVKRAAEHLNVAPSTAFRWRHRFLAVPRSVKPNALAGVAKIEETYVLESFKGQKVVGRKARKRGGSAAKPGLSGEQPNCRAIPCTPSPRRAITRISTACSRVNIDGPKAASSAQMGQIYFGAVGQLCIGGDTQQHWPDTAGQVCRATASTGRRRRSSRDPCPDPLTFNPRATTELLVRLKGAGHFHLVAKLLATS
jgi:transposase-like protein